MVDASEDAIMEERQELMVSPTGNNNNPTLRIARFLTPSVTSIDGPIFNLPLHSLFFSTTKSKPKKWPLQVTFNGWINPQKNWKTWVDHMHSLHQSIWKKAGIHDAVMNSTHKILENNNIILGFAEKWCFETNTFVFPWGEATITLEDIIVIGGYSVLGDSVFAENRELDVINEKLIQARRELARTRARKASYYLWIVKFMDSGSKIEHEAFLAMWLSRFVFPSSPYKTIGKNVFPIAVHLARGTKVALGPAVLASIYRGLRLLKEAIVASDKLETSECGDGASALLTIWAPMQLVQIWVWERFPTLGPKPNLIKDGEPRLARWEKLKKVVNIENVTLDIESSTTSEYFHWRPYAKAGNYSLYHEFYKDDEEWVLVDDGWDDELESLARCFRVSELVGLDCIEQYLPHRVARQFGMDQDLPGYVARVNTTPEAAWKNYTRPIGDAKLYFPSRVFESDVTTRHLEWWNQSMFDGDDETKAVMKKENSCENFKRIMSETSNGKKADNNALFPPGFPPKCSTKVEMSSDDEDKQTLTEIFRNIGNGNGKARLQSPSSSTADSATVQKVQPLVKPVENIVKSEPAMEGSEKAAAEAGTVVQNMASIDNKGEGSTLHVHEAPGLELKARISKLEKVVAQLKVAKFGHRFG